MRNVTRDELRSLPSTPHDGHIHTEYTRRHTWRGMATHRLPCSFFTNDRSDTLSHAGSAQAS